jgi:hypothetical protein
LSQASDFEESHRIQTDLSNPKLHVFGEQMKNLGEAYIKVAAGGGQDAVQKFAPRADFRHRGVQFLAGSACYRRFSE